MNPNIQKLAAVAAKKSRRIIGLMSGTSLDGLDIAVCRFTGAGDETKVEVEASATLPYDAELRNRLRNICSQETVSLHELVLLHKELSELHAAEVNRFLQSQHIDFTSIDLLSSHGQTVFHAPGDKATLQIGDGDILAMNTGIITISDFRQKHIAAGGEGAPLAAYGDRILFAEKGKTVIVVNIGGIANFTCLHTDGRVSCTDTGPGNGLMDRYISQQLPGKTFDENGTLAAKGKISSDLLSTLEDHEFFQKPFPKTTGPELFNDRFLAQALQACNAGLSVEDVMATLNFFTAKSIAEGIRDCCAHENFELFIGGGGTKNEILIRNLSRLLPGAIVRATKEKNIPADAKEAVLFALLANEAVAGDPANYRAAENFPSVSFGKISFPV